MKIIHIVGARPNFMKIAPIVDAFTIHNSAPGKGTDVEQFIVHTGQHYDERMSRLFFDELGIPKPDVNLEVGSSSHAQQTAEIMKRFEPIMLKENPDRVLVVGDVNSTVACSLVAAKLGIKVSHVEAGLRSYDRSMPEEINRVLTDAIADQLFVTEESGLVNLRKEGIPDEKVHFVGNVMIDTLLKHLKKAEQSLILDKLGLVQRDNPLSVRPYALMTMHRPSNVDNRKIFHNILEALHDISEILPIVFPIHPRTANQVERFGFKAIFKEIENNSGGHVMDKGIYCIEPQGYLDFLSLLSSSKLVLTDSGGIQEETTVLGVPCVTLRNNTERPVTVVNGTNIIAGTDSEEIKQAAFSQLDKAKKTGLSTQLPPLWDGKAAERIVDVIVKSEQ